MVILPARYHSHILFCSFNIIVEISRRYTAHREDNIPVLHHTTMNLCYLSTGRNTLLAVAAVLFVVLQCSVAVTRAENLTEFRNAIHELSGTTHDIDKADEDQIEDRRLVRYDATDHTKKQQQESEHCGKKMMKKVLKEISSTKKRSDSTADAIELLTWCITDNSENRAMLNGEAKFFAALKQYIPEYPVAAQLVWIASYNDKSNHEAFLSNDYVPALVEVIMAADAGTFSTKYTPLHIMWSAAALQNLAASYCKDNTESKGKCVWDWGDNASQHVVLDTNRDGNTLSIDSSNVRQSIVEQNPDLIPRLAGLVCQQGPARIPASDTNVFPGHNAMAGNVQHGNSWRIVPWAAIGLLKNLALHGPNKALLEPYLGCICGTEDSDDILETVKSSDFLLYIRRGHPCVSDFGSSGGGFGDVEDDDDAIVQEVCIDLDFFSADGVNCNTLDMGQEPPNAVTCKTLTDRFDASVTATAACCVCGGGFNTDTFGGGSDANMFSQNGYSGGDVPTNDEL